MTSETTAQYTTENKYEKSGWSNRRRTASGEVGITGIAQDYRRLRQLRPGRERDPDGGHTEVKNNTVTYDSLGSGDLEHRQHPPPHEHGDLPDEHPWEHGHVGRHRGHGRPGLDHTTIAADGFETSRASTVAGGSTLNRTVTARDDAKRLTAATLATGSATLSPDTPTTRPGTSPISGGADMSPALRTPQPTPTARQRP